MEAADAAQLAGRETSSGTPPNPTRDEQPMESGLGISVEPMSQEDAAARNLDVVRSAGGGLVVTDVSPDGPAAGKLAVPGPGGTDIILKVEAQPVRTRIDLRNALRKYKPGDIVTLVVYQLSADGSRAAQRVVRIRLP